MKQISNSNKVIFCQKKTAVFQSPRHFCFWNVGWFARKRGPASKPEWGQDSWSKWGLSWGSWTTKLCPKMVQELGPQCTPNLPPADENSENRRATFCPKFWPESGPSVKPQKDVHVVNLYIFPQIKTKTVAAFWTKFCPKCGPTVFRVFVCRPRLGQHFGHSFLSIFGWETRSDWQGTAAPIWGSKLAWFQTQN